FSDDSKKQSDGRLLCPKGRALDTTALCSQAREACQIYGTSYCYAKDPLIRARRAGFPPVGKAITRFAAKKQAEIRESEDFQNTCCGTDNRCKRMFSETRLAILTGGTPGDIEAHYIPEGGGPSSRWHQIEVSGAALFACYNQECVEQMLVHEMGHACQFSRIRSSDERVAFAKKLTSKEGCADRAPVPELHAALGDNTARCLTDALAKAAFDEMKTDTDLCFGAWQNEAFANTVFAHLTPTSYHWGIPCAGSQDEGHAAAKGYLHCVLERTAVQEALCGQ
ncbi:MAG: hypothetical protein AAB425_04255, partial [Bdellovibrionota bacterium]